jgi:hypothetical protein
MRPGHLGGQRLDISASADTANARGPRQDRRARAGADDVYDGPDDVAGTEDDFDAILFSANSGAGTPAKAGYPSIIVPGGFLPPAEPIVNPFPSGVTFSGPAFSEPTLIGLAYAFELATKYRVHRRHAAGSAPCGDGSTEVQGTKGSTHKGSRHRNASRGRPALVLAALR